MPDNKILPPMLISVGGYITGLTRDGRSVRLARHELNAYLAALGQRPVRPIPDAFGAFDVEDIPAPPARLHEQWRTLRRGRNIVVVCNVPHPSRNQALNQFTDGTVAGVLHIWTDEHGDHAEIERVTP